MEPILFLKIWLVSGIIASVIYAYKLTYWEHADVSEICEDIFFELILFLFGCLSISFILLYLILDWRQRRSAKEGLSAYIEKKQAARALADLETATTLNDLYMATYGIEGKPLKGCHDKLK